MSFRFGDRVRLNDKFMAGGVGTEGIYQPISAENNSIGWIFTADGDRIAVIEEELDLIGDTNGDN